VARREIRPRDRFEYGVVKLIQTLVCALPLGCARATGAGLGSLAWALGIRREVVLGHLERVFGREKDEEERRRIARESYRNFGRMVFEYARFPRLTPGLVERLLTLSGAEHLDRAIEGGRGAIIVAGHFGNWELFATLATMGYPMTFLVGEQHNILVDGLMNALRARFGVEIAPLTENLRPIFRALRANRVVAMLSDQDAGRRGLFVDFLGLPASTPYGAARFALATGAVLLPGAVVALGGGRHEIVISPAIEPPPEGLPAEERARRLTQAYTSVFEESILRHPEQYFWMHRRWKTRPTAS